MTAAPPSMTAASPAPSIPLPDFFQSVDPLSAPPNAGGLPPTRLSPGGTSVDLLLTALSPISHHDPAADKSNILLFNRRKQRVDSPPQPGRVSQAHVDALCAAHPAPADVADLLETVSFPEFAACCLARLFLDFYNGWNKGEGVGVFQGQERYELLETRLRAAAVQSGSLRGLWDLLCAKLQVPIHGGDADRALLTLLQSPRSLQAQVLHVIREDFRTVVSLARLWHSETKAQVKPYADKAGRAPALASRTLSFDAASLQSNEKSNENAALVSVVDVPYVSGNTLRHQIVRGPGGLHFAGRIGLPLGLPGDGLVSPSVEALFINGNNIRSKEKGGSGAPEAAWEMTHAIRRAHPFLDLLGGCMDGFILGDSHLHVAPWIVCRENALALRGTAAEHLPATALSVSDLLDEVTQTRQETDKGVGQMIYNFETLCAGTQIFCRLHLAPEAGRLTLGALAASVETYLHGLSSAGGQKARGFGWMRGEIVSCPDDWEESLAEYEHYLDANAEALKSGLVDGTLGARTRVVS